MVMIVSGVLLFCGDPVAFYSTTFFKVKMIMLVLAGLNVLIFNATIGRKTAEWDRAVENACGSEDCGRSLARAVGGDRGCGTSHRLCSAAAMRRRSGNDRWLKAILLSFCRYCNETWFGHGIRDSVWLFPFVEIFHLLALGVLGGTILLVNRGSWACALLTSPHPSSRRMFGRGHWEASA